MRNAHATSWLLAALFAVGTPAFAQGPGSAAHGPGMAGAGAHMGGGGQRMRGGEQGRGEGRLLGPHWTATLSDDQRARLDRLSVEHVRTQAPLQARMKALKAELAALATADKPDAQAIKTAIDDLTGLMRQRLTQRQAFVAEQRKLLTPEQRPSFDLEVLRTAGGGGHGGAGGGRHGRGH